jgi:hypothetical protein
VSQNRARYVYCITEGDEESSLGSTGIDGSEVYAIPAAGLCAVVHNCPAEPYASDDEKIVERWVISHQDVVEKAMKRYGTVLPMRFDTIIPDTDGVSAEQNIRKWLNDEGIGFKKRLDDLRGKEEYGVQIFWEPGTVASILSKTRPEIVQLDEEIRAKPKGLAYMYRQRLERLLKEEVEKEAEHSFRDFYHRIRGCAATIKVERTKKEQDKQMLMNLSCLIPRGGIGALANELEKIDSMDGFSVRFTGPWPPYSFATVE